MIRVLIFGCFLIASAEIKGLNNFGLNIENYRDLCGVWYLRQIHDSETEYSWGKAKEVVNGSLVIDLGEDQPFFTAGPMGDFFIKKVYKKNDEWFIKILFRDNNEYEFKISIIGKDKIIFHKMDWFDSIRILGQNYGKSKIYYRISGPKIQYYISKVKRLRLRSKPSIKGKLIRFVDEGEKLVFLKKGKMEEVGDLKGNWIKVLTEQNEIGWCFDYYLKKED